MTNGYQSFRQAMGGAVDYTFNWFYLDRHDIGYQHSCKCPQRAQGIDPYLPRGATAASTGRASSRSAHSRRR
jgi:hypothetical protein